GMPGLRVVFQAGGGIRDRSVTGVQTCALPILRRGRRDLRPEVMARTGAGGHPRLLLTRASTAIALAAADTYVVVLALTDMMNGELGRASCRASAESTARGPAGQPAHTRGARSM